MRRGTRAVVAGSALVGGGVLLARALARNGRDPDPEAAAAAAGATLPPWRERTVKGFGGTSLHVREFGPEDGTPILLAHGWFCRIEFWHHQIAALATDHRVIAYDQRGHGRSGWPADRDYSIETLGRDLAAVLGACVADGERAVVVGHSMGAMSTAALAAEDPVVLHERVSAVVLTNTGLGDLISEALIVGSVLGFEGPREAVGKLIMQAPGKLVAPEPVLRSIVRYMAMTAQAPDDAVALTAWMVRECHPAARAGCGGSMSRMDLRHAVEKLDIPAIVICGGDDRMTPLVHAKGMAEELPQLVELIELEGVGHMAPLEAPERVSDVIRELAASHAAVAAA